ncbi:hypothetical protein [Prolixibacter bellariivorans]|uniref:hypothetical protein n=1 Tax=Prolixibacter bellariivorans TaxID=314319 RepID=UPI000A7CDF5A|nr:hypothetical protein [Prolixibacter bellariivorans]
MAKRLQEEALEYHSQGRPGKIEVIPTKPYSTQKDLSLAYSPGVLRHVLRLRKMRRTHISTPPKETWLP